MKNLEKEYEICSEFKPSNARNEKAMLERNGKIVDNWYVYTTPDVYEKLFNKKLQGKEKLPWKRRVVKIYSNETNCSVYRIWRGTFRTVLSKDILYVDRDAKYILSKNNDKVSIKLFPSNKLLYYWNHFAPEIRAPFKLGMISLFIGFISLILGIISLIPKKINEMNEPEFNNTETQSTSYDFADLAEVNDLSNDGKINNATSDIQNLENKDNENLTITEETSNFPEQSNISNADYESKDTESEKTNSNQNNELNNQKDCVTEGAQSIDNLNLEEIGQSEIQDTIINNNEK